MTSNATTINPNCFREFLFSSLRSLSSGKESFVHGAQVTSLQRMLNACGMFLRRDEPGPRLLVWTASVIMSTMLISDPMIDKLENRVIVSAFVHYEGHHITLFVIHEDKPSTRMPKHNLLTVFNVVAESDIATPKSSFVNVAEYLLSVPGLYLNPADIKKAILSTRFIRIRAGYISSEGPYVVEGFIEPLTALSNPYSPSTNLIFIDPSHTISRQDFESFSNPAYIQSLTLMEKIRYIYHQFIVSYYAMNSNQMMWAVDGMFRALAIPLNLAVSNRLTPYGYPKHVFAMVKAKSAPTSNKILLYLNIVIRYYLNMIILSRLTK